MTARSPHVGIVDFEPALYRRSNDPMCASRVRDGVLNGVLHKADSVSQVRVNWQPVSEGLTVVGTPRRWATGRESTVAATRAGDWYVLEATPFGVVDVPVHGSGERYEYLLRTAWGAASPTFTDPPPAATIKVRIFLYPEGGDPRVEHDRAVDHVWEAEYEATVAGYSGAVLSGATRGPGAHATKLVLDPADDWPRVELDVPNSIGGGDRRPARVLRAAIGVAASVSLDPTPGEPPIFPLMRSLYVQGFVGVAGG